MRKRSAYRPKPVMSDPLSLLQPTNPARAGAVMLRFLTALEAMARGDEPGEAEWSDLSDAVNTVETLALHMGKLDPSEAMPLVNAAIAAMVGAANRHKAGKGMRLDAQGLQAMRAVVDVYGQCLEGLTEREMAQAQAETARRLRAILAGKASEGVTLCEPHAVESCGVTLAQRVGVVA